MGQALIDELLDRKAATKEQVDEAIRLRSGTSAPLSRCLLEVGCRPRDVLSALAKVSSLPVVPSKVLSKATRPARLPLPAADWWRLRAVPVGPKGGAFVVVTSEPETARDPRLAELGELRVYVALDDDVRDALQRMFGGEPGTERGGERGGERGTEGGAEREPMTLRTARSPAEPAAATDESRPTPPSFEEGDVATTLDVDHSFEHDDDIDAEADDFDDPTVALTEVSSRPSEDGFDGPTEAISVDDIAGQDISLSGLFDETTDRPLSDRSPSARRLDTHDALTVERELSSSSSAASSDDGMELLDEPMPGDDYFAEPATTAPEPTEPTPGGRTEISGYVLGEVLGQGGMATVYFATKKSSGETGALKLLSPQLGQDPGFVERFKREIRAMATLDHDHLIRVLDYGEDNGRYFLVSELMDRGSLRDVLDAAGQVPVALAVKLTEHLLAGLGHAHRAGTIHRDLKPGNLMLSSRGLLKIGDFGIAKTQTDTTITRTGALFGTPAYMSPEQALGRELDPRSDLFSVGIIAHEMIAGHNPYVCDTPSASLFKIARAEGPPVVEAAPGAPPLLQDVLDRLAAREPEQRYQSAGEVLADLWPLVDVVDARYPQLVRRYLAAPEETLGELRRDQAAAELERARRLLESGHPEPGAAALAALSATLLDPSDQDATHLLDELCAAHGFRFRPSSDPRIVDAERELEQKPHAPGLLKRLADLYRAVGNVHRSAAYLRRYLKVRPQDSQAQHLLGQLLGPEPLGAFAPPPKPLEDAPAQAAWKAPPELDWSAVPRPGDADGEPPPGTGAPEPSSEAASAAPREAPLEAPPPSGPELPAPEYLKPVLQGRAGGLRVLGSHPKRTYGPASRPRGAGAGERRPDLLPAGPVGAAAPPDPARKRSALWIALALGLGVALGVGAVLALTLGGTGGPGERLAALADPGPGAHVDVRQQTLLAQADKRYAAGEAAVARAMCDRLIELSPRSPYASQARLLRGKAHKILGEREDARRDLEEVVRSLPADNLLHLEAKALLQGL